MSKDLFREVYSLVKIGDRLEVPYYSGLVVAKDTVNVKPKHRIHLQLDNGTTKVLVEGIYSMNKYKII